MKNKFYTKEELQFLKDNIDKFGIDVCSKKLERNKSGVITKCYKEFGYCNYICKANENEIQDLVFKEKFKPISLNFSETEYKKELAYFIGYFWADGYINKNRNIFIELKRDDAEDIKHIFINVSVPNIYTRNRAGRSPQMSFHYYDYNKSVIKQLNELGKYSKSIESHKKIIEYIPDEYINYFIRGLFDGDGCLYISKDHRGTQLSISGRYEQDWEYIVDFFKKKYNITFKVIKNIYKEHKSSSIRSTNKKEIISFLNEVYGINDGIYLTRKYEKIEWLIDNNQKK